jgi:alpha-1,2-mannosyltransferase
VTAAPGRSLAQTLRRAWLSNGSLIILAAVAFALADATIVYIAVRGDFAIDFTCCYQQAGQRVFQDASSLYAWTDDYLFRYSPWAAVLFSVFAPMSETAAVWLWLGLKVVVLVAVAIGLARRWPGDVRWLVAGMVLFFPPIWHDLALGNVSTFTVAALAVILARRDGWGGLAFGLLLLLVPKPHLLPIAVWLAVRRPRDAVAALATLTVGVVAGVLSFGPELWLEWLATFREPLERTFTANVAFSGLLGPPGVAVGVAAAVVIGVAALVRRTDIGLGLSLVSGIVLGPYSFIHYLSGLVVVVDPVLRARPRWLAPYPWLLVVFPLIPVWLLALGWTMWRTPDPVAEAAAEPPAAAPG